MWKWHRTCRMLFWNTWVAGVGGIVWRPLCQLRGLYLWRLTINMINDYSKNLSPLSRDASKPQEKNILNFASLPVAWKALWNNRTLTRLLYSILKFIQVLADFSHIGMIWVSFDKHYLIWLLHSMFLIWPLPALSAFGTLFSVFLKKFNCYQRISLWQ